MIQTKFGYEIVFVFVDLCIRYGCQRSFLQSLHIDVYVLALDARITTATI